MRILEIDIETMANLAWVWGLYKQDIPINMIEKPARMICFAARFQGDKQVVFKSEWDHGTDRMLTTLWDMVDEADAVLHFNGARFDMRHINREFLENGFLPPSPYKNIDLLKIYRKKFLSPSNKLDYIVQRLFNKRKLDTGGFSLWKGATSGSVPHQTKMKRYNIKDVKLLTPLYNKLRPWIDTHPNAAMYKDPSTDRPSCKICGYNKMHINKDKYVDGLGVYTLYRCHKCHSYAKGRFRKVPTGKGILK